MAKIKKEGVLLVISSPSGTGKTTICKKLLEYDKNIHLSVSVTTRKKRINEVEGIDYYFRSKKDFLNLKSQNSFIENAFVFENYYGTLKSEVLEQLENGIDVLIDIDWQGTRQITQAMKGNLIKIFLLPDSVIFFITLIISQGAKNCPFLTLIILFVLAAATNKSVCLHKKAGIWIISTWLATAEHCSVLWTSVKIGTPNSCLILSKIGNEFSKPAPLFPFKLVLLALSKEVL